MGEPRNIAHDKDCRQVMAARLRELRAKEEWSQAHVAALCHTHQRNVSRAENGLWTGLDLLPRFAVAYGVTTDYLLGLDSQIQLPADVLEELRETVASVTSSLDFHKDHPEEVSVRYLNTTAWMLSRFRRDLVRIGMKVVPRKGGGDGVGR